MVIVISTAKKYIYIYSAAIHHCFHRYVLKMSMYKNASIYTIYCKN